MVTNYAAASHIIQTYRKNTKSVNASKSNLTKRFGTYTCHIDMSLLVGDNLATVSQVTILI